MLEITLGRVAKAIISPLTPVPYYFRTHKISTSFVQPFNTSWDTVGLVTISIWTVNILRCFGISHYSALEIFGAGHEVTMEKWPGRTNIKKLVIITVLADVTV